MREINKRNVSLLSMSAYTPNALCTKLLLAISSIHLKNIQVKLQTDPHRRYQTPPNISTIIHKIIHVMCRLMSERKINITSRIKFTHNNRAKIIARVKYVSKFIRYQYLKIIENKSFISQRKFDSSYSYLTDESLFVVKRNLVIIRQTK